MAVIKIFIDFLYYYVIMFYIKNEILKGENILKDKKNVIIFLSVIIIVLLIIIAVFLFFNLNNNTLINTNSLSNKNEKINTSTLSYPELKDFLEEKGYNFDTETIQNTNFTYFSNEEISVSAAIFIDSYKYIISYWDKSFEGPACYITDIAGNDTENKQKQYSSYLKWRESIGLSEEQIKEVLLNYYLENK